MFDNLPTNDQNNQGKAGPIPPPVKPGSLGNGDNPMTRGFSGSQDFGQNPPSGANQPEVQKAPTSNVPKPPQRGVEDIFSEGSEPRKPDAFLPKNQITGQVNSQGYGQMQTDPYAQEAVSAKSKTLVLALMLVSLLLVIIVGWYAYRLVFSAMTTPPALNDIGQNDDLTENGNNGANPSTNEGNTSIEDSEITNEQKNETEISNNIIDQDPPAVVDSNKDTDGDGLSDAEEAEIGSNELLSDSDGDGLFDREEVKVYETDPMNSDTDGDGYSDGKEVKSGYNPKGEGKLFSL